MAYELYIEDNNELILDFNEETLEALSNHDKYKTNIADFFKLILENIKDNQNGVLEEVETKKLLDVVKEEYPHMRSFGYGYWNKDNLYLSKFARTSLWVSDVLQRFDNVMSDSPGRLVVVKGYEFKDEHFKSKIFQYTPKRTFGIVPLYLCTITHKDNKVYAGKYEYEDRLERSGIITRSWVAYHSPFKGPVIRSRKYINGFDYKACGLQVFNEHVIDVIKTTIVRYNERKPEDHTSIEAPKVKILSFQ